MLESVMYGVIDSQDDALWTHLLLVMHAALLVTWRQVVEEMSNLL